MGALSYWLSYILKGITNSQLVGDGVIFLILVGLSGYMWWRAQQQKVDHSNVNADWDETTNSVVPAANPDTTPSSAETTPTAAV